MYVIIFKQHGWLNCEQQVYGPFDSYADAEEAFANGNTPRLSTWAEREEVGEPVPDNGHKYIQELNWVEGCVL
jgi:hypothetical protein